MADNYVITIAREYGSGGKTIGRMMSERWGVPFYDNEILRKASEISGINETLFVEADEKVKGSLFKSSKPVYEGKVLPPDHARFVSDENLFNYQAKIIRHLADTESCIIVGRCADYVLRDHDRVMRLFVHAPQEFCIRKTMEVHGDRTEEEALKYLQKMNKQRAEYYRYFTGCDWQDARNYDLCINSSRCPWEKSVELVEAYRRVLLGV